MEPEEWKQLVIAEARKLSDRAYQERTWFGDGERISSPEELYCGLFDDYIFEDFLVDERVALNERQRAAGRALKKALEKYSGRLDETPDPRQVIDDPHWDEVRSAAADFVQAMESSGGRA